MPMMWSEGSLIGRPFDHIRYSILNLTFCSINIGGLFEQVDQYDPDGNTYGAAKLLAIQTMGVGYLEKARQAYGCSGQC